MALNFFDHLHFIAFRDMVLPQLENGASTIRIRLESLPNPVRLCVNVGILGVCYVLLRAVLPPNSVANVARARIANE